MSTKKKRKRQRTSKPSAPPRFSIGDQVRTRHGTADPDFPDIPIGGWAGTVADVSRQGHWPLYLVKWNGPTLENMHPVFRKRCQRDDLDETQSWLGDGDLEADTGEPVPIEQPEQIVTRPLSAGNRGDRIRAIFGLTSDDPLPEVNRGNLCKYRAHLAATLSLPFQAHWEETLPFSTQKYRVTVVGLVDADEYDPDEVYGLLCEIRRDEADSRQTSAVIEGLRQNHAGVLQFLRKLLGLWAPPVVPCRQGHCLPLAEIEIRKRNHNRQLIGDYASWFWDYG